MALLGLVACLSMLVATDIMENEERKNIEKAKEAEMEHFFESIKEEAA